MAAQVLVNSYNVIKLEDATGMLMDVKLGDAATNRRLFELDGSVPMGYDALFNTANKIWKKVGLLDQPNRADVTRNSSFVAEATAKQAGTGAKPAEEAPKTPATPSEQKAQPIVTKPMTVYFATGSSTLDANAKSILAGAAEFAQTFGATYIRVSGNTDSVGGRQMNIDLSQRRAQAVVDFLVKEYGFPKEKFIVKGNGPDKPVASNDTEEGRAKNRRTDFEVIPQEQAQ
jgi:NitT/TauT family transport system substrate-binding protein